MYKKGGALTWIVIIVIVIIVLFLFAAGNDTEVTDDQNGENGDQSSAVPAGEDVVAASEQAPGDSATVAMAVLSEDGYVVIHADDNGAPGAILGSSALLTAGSHQNVSLELSETAEAGATLWAMIHADNGDGEFNPQDDPAVTDDEGNIVTMSFGISAEVSGDAEVSL